MNVEIHHADWSIPYPDSCEPEMMPKVFRPLTNVEHERPNFPWHLIRQLAGLLEKPAARFEYLQLTTYCKARAANLMLNGNVQNRALFFASLSQHRVQVGGMYRRLLIRHVSEFLATHNIAQLPKCEDRDIAFTGDPHQIEKNRAVFQCLLTIVEDVCLQILVVISVSTDLKEVIAGHSLEEWIQGIDLPEAIGLRVSVSRDDIGLELTPLLEERKRHIHEGLAAQTITIRAQDEFLFSKSERESTHPQPGSHTSLAHTAAIGVGSEKKQPYECPGADDKGQSEKPSAKVIGDFTSIILPSKRVMSLTRKYKGRPFLRAMALYCTEHQTDTFFWQEVVDDYNARFTDPNQRKLRISTDRIDFDLFGKQKSEFRELVEILDRTAGRMRLKVRFEYTGEPTLAASSKTKKKPLR